MEFPSPIFNFWINDRPSNSIRYQVQAHAQQLRPQKDPVYLQNLNSSICSYQGITRTTTNSSVLSCSANIGKGNTNGQPVLVRRRPVPTKPFVLPSVPQCVHCHAKRFPFEPDGFCCSKGQVSLYPLCTSDKLLNLYRDSSKLSKDVRTHIRPYNNMFAFTSFGVTLDPRYTKNHQGIYTFRAQGQIYHFLRTLYPADGKPSYLQLYF